MRADEAQLWLPYAKSDLDAAYVLLEKVDFFPPRYPGHTPDVTEYEARNTLNLAEAVVEAVSTELDKRIQRSNFDRSIKSK